MMLRYCFLTGLCLTILFNPSAYASDQTLNLDQEISPIPYQVTAIEHNFTDKQTAKKIKAFDALITKTDKLLTQFPDSPEPYVWKGIALSAQAKHKGKGFAALRAAKQARKYLQQAINMNPAVSDGAAYNALAMLYAKVPSWPIAFGNRRKAEEYFQKAITVSSNLDTNYRYGEFLLEEGRITEGLTYLKKALSFPDRSRRKEDPLKKMEISALIKEYAHE